MMCVETLNQESASPTVTFYVNIYSSKGKKEITTRFAE